MLTLMVITLIWRKRREILPLLQKFLPFIPAPAMVRVQTKVLPAAFPRVKK